MGIGLELGLTAVIAAVGAGWLVRAHPVDLEPLDAPVQVAAAPVGDPGADVLVVLPTVPEAHSFESMSFDQAWLNTVEREIGTAQIVDTSALSRAIMDRAAWVVVPRRAASQLDPTQTQFIRTWVEDGGTVIVEQPEGPWRGLIGQSLSASRARETRRITSFDAALSRGEMRADILEMPLRTSIVPYNPASLTRGRDYQVLLEIDGQPGIVSLHLGQGRVILLLFDFGQAAVRMTQGLPNGDFTVRRPADTDAAADVAYAAQLVSDASLHTSQIPFVDLLERNILYLADVQRPVGRLWQYPGATRGALLVAHSEALYGPSAGYMPDWEHEHDVRSTMFAVPGGLSPEALARIGRVGTDLELQWVPAADPRAPTRDWGAGNFRPIRRAMRLGEQIAWANHDLIPYGPITATRTLDGLWSTTYFEAFRTLDAQNVVLDSSYGPTARVAGPEGESAGYLFATGRPFHPIDLNGHRFAVAELPVLLDASTPGYTSQRVRSLIIDSSDGYHTVVAADWRPDVMAHRPSYDAVDGWQTAFELARSQELWVTTWSDFAEFLVRREQSHIQSTFAREERRLTIEARLEAPAGSDDEAALLTPSIAFPARFEGRPVDRLIVDNVATPTSTLGLTGDRVLHLLPVEPGEHRIQVIYGTPVEVLP